MNIPPAVIVHSLADARAATAIGRRVTLLSAPGAARYAGCLWWAALLQAAEFSGVSLLDCGDAPGRAVEAMRLGLPGIVLACEQPAFGMVAEIAAQSGCLLLPAAPPALDMAAKNAPRRLLAWLGEWVSDTPAQIPKD